MPPILSPLPCDRLPGPGSWPLYCMMSSLKTFPVDVNGNAVICDQGSLESKMLWDASYSKRHWSLTEGWGLRIRWTHRPGNFFRVSSSSEFVMHRTYLGERCLSGWLMISFFFHSAGSWLPTSADAPFSLNQCSIWSSFLSGKQKLSHLVIFVKHSFNDEENPQKYIPAWSLRLTIQYSVFYLLKQKTCFGGNWLWNTVVSENVWFPYDYYFWGINFALRISPSLAVLEAINSQPYTCWANASPLSSTKAQTLSSWGWTTLFQRSADCSRHRIWI